MSDRVPGRLSRPRLAGRIALLLGFLALAAGPAAPAVGAAGLTVTTPFPAVVVQPGSTASFKLTIDVPSKRTVDLKATGFPADWIARFRGGGLVIDSVYVDPSSPPDVTLDVEVPGSAVPGSTSITVEATSGALSDKLDLSLRIADAGVGDVSLTTDNPELRGPSSSSFSFSLTLHNDTAAEITFGIDATGPDGWTVTANPAGQSQATSTSVQPGSTASISVSAKAPTDAAADTYPIRVTASGGDKTATSDLAVVITGTFTMTMSTPNGVLSTTANAGSETSFQMTIANTGTAPITNVTPSASTPTNWKVTFNPDKIASIEAGQTQPVTALITPSSDAIAGDYELTMTARGTEANDSTTIRVRVETPQFWWIVGIVLIGATFVGLYWVFRTYGRR